MTSSPITSGQIEGVTMETVTDFIFLGSKIAVNHDCSQEIKTLGPRKKKSKTHLDSVLSRDITLPTKFHIVKIMVFSVVM